MSGLEKKENSMIWMYAVMFIGVLVLRMTGQIAQGDDLFSFISCIGILMILAKLEWRDSK